MVQATNYSILKKTTEPFVHHDFSQKPGTSGLRKKTKVFLQENYIENYIQSIFNTLEIKGKTILIGGDGRYLNKVALQKTISQAIANKAKGVIVAKGGILSTPATSAIIRKHKLDYAIIFSASHNPGGINGDFGIKVDYNNGAPLNVELSNNIYEETKVISSYKILEEAFNIDIDKEGSSIINDTLVKVFNPIIDYINLLQDIFDFSLIKKYLQNHNFYFNAFNGATGPYAYCIFHECLGVPKENLFNIVPKDDFGGISPDPNPTTAKSYIEKIKPIMQEGDLATACDADGDRNMLFTSKYYIEPSDSLAIIAQYIKDIPFYKDIKGFARTKATSSALDLVAEEANIPVFITPTGWKFFSSLLDNNLVGLCGEESFGIGSNHIREKDGIWTILCWLHVMASNNLSPNILQENLWKKYGRVYFTRYDYLDLSESKVSKMLENINNKLFTKNNISEDSFKNKEIISDFIITKAYNFNYQDPLSKDITKNQGLVIEFQNGLHIIIRTSGTGTTGVTIRVYAYILNKKEYYLDKNTYFTFLTDILTALIGYKIEPDFIV